VTPLLLTAVLLAGLALGSFATVVAARVPAGRSVARPRSACPGCDRGIAWYDNVPVLSYALLHGRCRHCRSSIGLAYPAVEALVGALCVACAVAFGATAYALLAALFCGCLVVVSATDVSHRIVPNVVVLPAALAVLAARNAIDPSPEWGIAALGAALFLLAAALAYPGGLGMGDVKLALLLGAMLGRDVTVALLVGFLAALVPSLVLLARHGAAARKMAIPLAPFLALGALVALFAGGAIVDAYLGLLR
jgi:leader peptidase (prepilin peptidase)/N-methyltransferase